MQALMYPILIIQGERKAFRWLVDMYYIKQTKEINRNIFHFSAAKMPHLAIRQKVKCYVDIDIRFSLTTLICYKNRTVKIYRLYPFIPQGTQIV